MSLSLTILYASLLIWTLRCCHRQPRLTFKACHKLEQFPKGGHGSCTRWQHRLLPGRAGRLDYYHVQRNHTAWRVSSYHPDSLNLWVTD